MLSIRKQRILQILWILLALVMIIHSSTSIFSIQPESSQICSITGCSSNTYSKHELQTLGLSLAEINLYTHILMLLFLITCLGLSALLMWKVAHERMAYYTAFTLVAFGGTAFSKIDTFFTSSIWATGIIAIACAGQILFFLFFYLFPDGKYVPHWTRYPGIINIPLLIIYYIEIYVPVIYHTGAIPPWLHTGLLTVITSWSILLFSSIIFAQIYRYRHKSDLLQRRQTILVMLSLLSTLFVYLAITAIRPTIIAHVQGLLLFDVTATTIMTICLLSIPITIGIAILHNQLWELNPLLNRSIVYSTLSILIISIYILVVGTLSTLFQSSNNLLISLIATGCIAILLQPLRNFIQQMINRLMYGERDNPQIVLSRLGQQLEAALSTSTMPQTIVDTVTQALKLPYAALQISYRDKQATVASYGNSQAYQEGQLLHLPLIAQNETVGELILATRRPNETFTEADKRLLKDFAYQAGLAVQAVRLSADLQRSREQLILAREEERRRIRRDLHDGLAPTLAALALGASTIGDVITIQPALAIDMAKELNQNLLDAIGDIRRLVYDLRPPTLDELGLLAAIHEYIQQQTQTSRGTNIDASIQLPEQLPTLPAALEVAIFRIIQEAFMNILRHAQASHCLLQLTYDEHTGIHLHIRDDGIGLQEQHRIGVGLLSMRERASELGGTCTIANTAAGGTSITIQLPLTNEH
ncbi:hypothetical protein KDA_65190 [Dictyobacter alpinus]|uniref:Oxygen sensor histidine kinase NreB n=1 Tax=Dictyobacter alpinus TaxID=2014873 RepID=A0A402BI49_9CHLR|nr:GAF domain-containing sensor histidine kinase [Dictyobacter alpinus]GCE31035.1 hypothetical protein KDA_65190 [Dictyobacter alpinus]